jgi:hypothetical protein
MSNASTPSIAEHGAANAVSSIDWEKEDREARHQSNVDFELVAQEDLLAHGTPNPVYPSYPNPDEYYEQQWEMPDHEYNY